MTDGTNAAGCRDSKTERLKSDGAAKQLGLLLTVGGAERLLFENSFFWGREQ